jgi:hypothetical protein
VDRTIKEKSAYLVTNSLAMNSLAMNKLAMNKLAMNNVAMLLMESSILTKKR